MCIIRLGEGVRAGGRAGKLGEKREKSPGAQLENPSK